MTRRRREPGPADLQDHDSPSAGPSAAPQPDVAPSASAPACFSFCGAWPTSGSAAASAQRPAAPGPEEAGRLEVLLDVLLDVLLQVLQEVKFLTFSFSLFCWSSSALLCQLPSTSSSSVTVSPGGRTPSESGEELMVSSSSLETCCETSRQQRERSLLRSCWLGPLVSWTRRKPSG